jgi:hypothetical protein
MAEENKGDSGAGDQKTEAQIEQKGAEQKPEPKYTDAQLNDLIAKEASKREAKARTELMEKLGVKTPEELDALKKLREEKMTESEKAAAAIKEKDDALVKAKEEADNARAEAEAMKRGVPADRLARFVKMARTFDGETMAEKIEAAIKEFPEFAAKSATGGNVGKETSHETQSEEEKLLALARKQVGLSK